MLRRFVSILLSIVLLCSLIPAWAEAPNENVVQDEEEPGTAVVEQSAPEQAEGEYAGLPAGSLYVHDEASVKEFARLYIEGNSMDMLYGMFDKVLVMHVPKTYFSNQLKAVENITGKFVDFGEYRLIQNEKTDTHILYLNFENKTEIMMLTMGIPYRVKQPEPLKTHIHGLLFAMTEKGKSAASYRPVKTEPSAKEASFTETELKIGKKPWMLDAKLNIPDGEAQRYPAVLFIGDPASGDMDDTFDGVSMLKDLAENLALNGVASLRFHQRAYQYANENIKDKDDFTAKEEIVEDAVFALKRLAEEEKIDLSQLYIVAHGNSAYYVPAIIQASNIAITGIALLGSSPLSQLELTKTAYMNAFATLEGEALAKAIKETLADLENADRLSQLSESEAKSLRLFGRNAYYFWEQSDYQPQKYYQETNVPLYIMQGSEDSVVSSAMGMHLWSSLLEKKENVDFKLYGGLDHYFSEGDMQPVHEDVALDLQGWILAKKEEEKWN